MPFYAVLIVAVVAGWILQLVLAYRQSMAFNDAVRALRRRGTVTVGAAGQRYRGGRAFVALAVDDHQIVRDAISLSGWTTFARARPLPGLLDVKLNHVRGDREFPQLTKQQREAARQAAELFRRERSPQAPGPQPARAT